MALIFLLVLVTVFRGLSGFSSATHARERPLQEITLVNHGSQNKILVLDIQGIITGMDRGGLNMVDLAKRQLRQAARDTRIKAVVLRINSPGGEVLASDEIHNAIASFQKEAAKPVVASMGSLAASGGYYVAAPCQWIVANQLTITGSIGVIFQGLNYRGLMEKIGLQPDVYKSGDHKDMLSGARWPTEVPEEERRLVADLVMETYSRFTNVVHEGRANAYTINFNGRPLGEEWTNYVDGRVFSGAQAYELGFVDELGNFERAVERAQRLAGIENANLIQFQQPFQLGDLFRLSGQADRSSVRIDLGVDIPRLTPGNLYFITPLILP